MCFSFLPPVSLVTPDATPIPRGSHTMWYVSYHHNPACAGSHQLVFFFPFFAFSAQGWSFRFLFLLLYLEYFLLHFFTINRGLHRLPVRILTFFPPPSRKKKVFIKDVPVPDIQKGPDIRLNVLLGF